MEPWVVVFLVTVGYLGLSLTVGLLSGGKTSAGTEGYVAGDRALGLLILYFVMGASIFSAFAFLGGPGWAYSRGAAAYYILSYTSLGLVPMYFFGPRVARLGRRFGYVTQAELFAHRYHSRYLSALLALISLAAFVPYLTLQMQGAGYVFSIVTEGRMPVWAGAAVTYAVVLLYVFRAGVMGIAWTNTFQGILMMGLAWGLGLYLPYRLHGGIGPMFQQLADAAPAMLAAPGLDAAGAPWTWGGYSSAVAISVFGFSVWPHYFMKIYAARSIRTLRHTVVLYPTFAFFLLPILLIGFSGVLAFPDVTPVDTILPTIVTSLGLPPSSSVCSAPARWPPRCRAATPSSMPPPPCSSRTATGCSSGRRSATSRRRVSSAGPSSPSAPSPTTLPSRRRSRWSSSSCCRTVSSRRSSRR